LTHGVDLEFWQTAHPPESELFAGLEPPFVVFWGVIDRRMDVPFVKRLAETQDRGTVVLIGPQDHPDPTLLATNRVTVRPAQPFDRLPGIAAAAAVLVMPYADLPVTRAMQPLKLKEYLATGKPVVVRDLPATREWADACDVASAADQFAGLVRERLVTGLPAHQKEARNRLAQEGWAAKAAMLDGWLG
jgi:glycosyltransferase involved in cell wall biosynthesis